MLNTIEKYDPNCNLLVLNFPLNIIIVHYYENEHRHSNSFHTNSFHNSTDFQEPTM